MICRTCLRKGSSLRPSLPIRAFTTSSPFLSSTTAPLSTPASTPTVSTPIPSSIPTISTPSLSTPLKPKPKAVAIPVSSCPAGKVMKGINYIQGRDDPVALAEEEYPEWLWRILDAKKSAAGEGEESGEGDEFSKSKKLRRKAAKRQRKLEAALLASGDTSIFEPKIPLTQQSIDLPSNEENTVEGALDAVAGREEIRKAMRQERRKAIKTKNYLKSM